MSMPDLLAKRGTQISPPAVSEYIRQARHLEAQGHNLTYLVRGEPDFDTPANISRAANRALLDGCTHYPPPQGIPELRNAVTARMTRDFGQVFDPESEILITTGATMGYYLAIQAIVDPGDEVLLFDPAYDPYEGAVYLAGGVPIRVPTYEEDGHFIASPENIEQAISPRTIAIVVNNPWNPTGTAMTAAELNTLVDLAEAHDFILIADEIYEKIIFEGRKHQNLAGLSDKARARTITINSFSKTYAMTGWRLGYNLAPAELCKRMLLISQQFSRSATTFVQYAGVEALTGPQESVADMIAAYARRRELVEGMLTSATVGRFSPPEGTFFVFLDVSQFGKTSYELAEYLLNEAGVVTIPGRVYGASGEGYIRFSFAYDEDTIIEGISRMIKGLQSL